MLWVRNGPGKPGTHLVNIHKVWMRICARAGLRSIRIHDLRHSYASVAVGAGVGLYLAGKIPGRHRNTTTERHAHLADGPVRQANDLVGRRIDAAMKPNRDAVARQFGRLMAARTGRSGPAPPFRRVRHGRASRARGSARREKGPRQFPANLRSDQVGNPAALGFLRSARGSSVATCQVITTSGHEGQTRRRCSGAIPCSIAPSRVRNMATRCLVARMNSRSCFSPSSKTAARYSPARNSAGPCRFLLRCARR